MECELSQIHVLSFPEQNIPFSHDDSEHPLLRVTVRWFRTYDLEAHLQQMLRLMQRGPVALTYDIREPRALSYREAQLCAALFRQHGDLLRRVCLGGAIICERPLQRGMLTSINWMCPIPFPVRIFSCPLEGELWVRGLLSASTSSSVDCGRGPAVPELGM